MGFLGKAVRYTVPKVSVNRRGIRFGNHFGGVSSSWSGNPRADFGIGPVRARIGSRPYQGGRISSSSPGVSPTQEYVDLSGTRAPVIPSRDRNQRPGLKSIKKHGVIGLFPQTFHQHVATLLVYAGLFSSFLLTAITRFFAQEYRVQNELWMDDKISEFLPDVLAFLCLCFFVFSLISFLISHLPAIADAESVKWKRITQSVVLIFFDLYIFFSVFTKPNSAQKVLDLSGDALVFNWIFIFPISAICTFVSLRSLIHSIEHPNRTKKRKQKILEQKNRDRLSAHETQKTTQEAYEYIRRTDRLQTDARIFQQNQQIAFAFDQGRARRLIRKADRADLKADYETALVGLSEVIQRVLREFPNYDQSLRSLDSSKFNSLEGDLRTAFSNADNCLYQSRMAFSRRKMKRFENELMQKRVDLADKFGFQNLK